MDILSEEDKQLFYCYFQRSPDYYIERLEKFKSGKTIIFNPFALISGIFWFLFRKLYLEFFIIIIIFLTAENQLENYMYENTGLYQYYKLINVFVTFYLVLFYGMFGNYFYFKKACRQVELAKSKFNGHQERMEYLVKKGGTSMIPIFIAVVLFIALLALIDQYYKIT